MSTEVGSAFVSIMPSAKGFGSNLGKMVDGESGKAGARGGKAFGGTFARTSAGPLKSVIGMVGGPLIAGFAAVAGIHVFKGFVDDARESIKVGKITAQVIKSTGGAAGLTAAQVGRLSTAISNKTGIDDEAIQSGANLLLTFTNLRNESGKGNKIFDRATSIMTDMSVALGTDAKSSAIQLGKALNDPVKGITALQRVGVSFTQAQKDQIAKLVKHGDTLKAQKIILHELGREFGGTAAAASTPMDKLKVTLGNVGEAIGTKLIPFLDKGAAGVGAFIASLQSGTSSGTGFVGFMSRLGVTMKTQIIPALERFGAFLQANVLPTLVRVGAFIMSTIVPALVQMAAFVRRNSAFFVPFAQTILVIVAALKAWAIAQAIINVVLTANPIGIVVVAIAALVAGIVIAYRRSETFRTVVQAAFKGVSTAASVMWTVFKAVFRFLAEAFLTTTGIIINGAAKMFGWVPGIGGKLKAAAAHFNDFAAAVRAKLSGAEQLGRDFSAGLARGIIAGSGAPVAAAVGVANRVTAGYAAAQKSHSPSKVAIQLGEFFSHGIAIGIQSGGKKALGAVTELVDKVKSKASELKQAARDMASGVADSVKGVVDIGAIGAAITTTDSNGKDTTRTPSLSETLGGFASQAKAFATALAAMAKKGLAPALIAAVAAAGPASGLTAAQALASASTADVKSVNADMASIAKSAGSAASTVVKTTPLPAEIARAEKQLHTMERIEKALKEKQVAEVEIRNSKLFVKFVNDTNKADARKK